MRDTLFVQFYDYIEKYNTYNLCNGFSDTYDLCKNKGDFYWVKHNLPNHNKNHLGYSDDFIINKGTVYVSASYISHLYRVYIWALRYPDIQFIVGGPCIMFPYWKVLKPLPINILLVEESLEEYFGISNFSYKWKLKVPLNIKDGRIISYNYFLEKYCHWRKCMFCAFTRNTNINHRFREDIRYEFMNVDYDGKKEIRVGSDSLSPKYITKFFQDIPYMSDLKQYRVFMRPDKYEMRSLQSLRGNFNIKFNMGLEFPTKRMWRYMSKGFDYKTVSDCLNYMASDERFSMILNFIIGWNNLVEQDLVELEIFLRRLSFSKDTTFSIHTLYILGDLKFGGIYNPLKELIYDNVFFVGWKPKISKYQQKLNQEAIKILKRVAKEKSVSYRVTW